MNRPLWWVAWVVCLPILYGPYRLRRRGVEHIPREGPVLFVCNHVSMRDPVFVGASTLPRRAHFMAKSELFRVRAFGWLIRGLGAFPVVRGGADREAFRTARGLLATGECVVMFPEGTRSRDGRLLQPHPGAGALALAPGVAVVPMAIWGTQRRLGPVRIAIGPPVDLSDLGDGARGRRAEQATERIMAAIAAVLPAAGGPVQEPAVRAGGRA
jgi:1-acyl-sn-glycerol-3-phosphate acyltransferase